MNRKYIVVADDSIKGFDEEIAKLEREWGAEEIEPCEDCISREQGVNELKLAYFNKDLQSAKDDPCIVDAMTDWAIRIIKRLPSVTPSNDAIREAYIKGYDYGVKDWFKAKTEPCEDAISRSDAINSAIDAVDEWDGGCNTNRANIITNAINDLPSVQPQPKKGKWISKFVGCVEFITCDNCHCGCPSYSYINIDNGESTEKVQLCKTDFCPNCGADMRGEEE